jgi:hypothetical protein
VFPQEAEEVERKRREEREAKEAEERRRQEEEAKLLIYVERDFAPRPWTSLGSEPEVNILTIKKNRPLVSLHSDHNVVRSAKRKFSLLHSQHMDHFLLPSSCKNLDSGLFFCKIRFHIASAVVVAILEHQLS